MIIVNQTIARPEKPGHPHATPFEKKKRLTVLLIILLILAAIFAAFLIWQQVNRSNAAKIIGSWYCADEDIQYSFLEDGTFTATNGQTTLLDGTWKAGLFSRTLILDFDVEGEAHNLSTGYDLNEAADQLKLDDINSKSLTMNRLKDS